MSYCKLFSNIKSESNEKSAGLLTLLTHEARSDSNAHIRAYVTSVTMHFTGSSKTRDNFLVRPSDRSLASVLVWLLCRLVAAALW